MPRRSTGKPPVVVTFAEADALKRDHITAVLPTFTKTEVPVVRRDHLFRALIPANEATELRKHHLATEVEPALLYRMQLRHEYLILCERDRQYFGVDEIPERIMLKFEKVVGEPDDTKARELAHRAWKSMEVHCLSQWARGRAPGPPTRENLERKLRNAEGLVRMFEDKDQPIAAAKQRTRVLELKSQLTHLSLL